MGFDPFRTGITTRCYLTNGTLTVGGTFVDLERPVPGRGGLVKTWLAQKIAIQPEIVGFSRPIREAPGQ